MDSQEKMVVHQIVGRGICDEKVLDAMRKIKRHQFVPVRFRLSAYGDHPLSIGHDQTISQPYIVAYMSEALQLKPGDRVLEIGTGCGYQAAVLARIAAEVFSVEVIEELAGSAKQRLKKLGYKNIHIKHGDGYEGWLEEAPFDAIIVTAAPTDIPPELIKQLKEGGRMIIPVGDDKQELQLITKMAQGVSKERLLPVRFVPMVEK